MCHNVVKTFCGLRAYAPGWQGNHLQLLAVWENKGAECVMALEGSLRDMSLIDLIRFLRMRNRSGVLVLTDDAKRGTLYLSVGQVIDATLVYGHDHQVGASAEEAVLRMLQWEEGSFCFQFDSDVAGRAVRISYDSEWLIEESRRRRTNPLRALPPSPITLDTRIDLAALPASAESGIHLDLDQWRILSQVAVSHDVRTICEVTGLPPEQAIAILADLAAIGLVDIATPPASAAQVPLAAEAYASATPQARGISPRSPPAATRLGRLFRRIRQPGATWLRSISEPSGERRIDSDE